MTHWLTCCLFFPAWNMNGKPITPDHGYPLRIIVPGQIGGRSVKVFINLTLFTSVAKKPS